MVKTGEMGIPRSGCVPPVQEDRPPVGGACWIASNGTTTDNMLLLWRSSCERVSHQKSHRIVVGTTIGGLVEWLWARVAKSGGGKADGLKGSMEFLAQCDVVFVQSGGVFWPRAQGAYDASQQRLNDLLAQKEVGA